MEIPTNILSTDKQLYTVHRQIDRQVERIIKYKKTQTYKQKDGDCQTDERKGKYRGFANIYQK